MTKRIKREEAIGVVIDYQERLMPSIYEGEKAAETAAKLVRGLKAHGVPLLVTTQYARGLGDTVEPVASVLEDLEILDKNTFSCFRNPEFQKALEDSGKTSVVVFGVESHICVQQTVMDLLDKGYKVYLIEDACSSRKERDHRIAMGRMAGEGAAVTTYEAILFELMEGSKDPAFKEISAIVK